MYIYIYICMYTSGQIFIYMYIYINICVHMYTNLYIYIRRVSTGDIICLVPSFHGTMDQMGLPICPRYPFYNRRESTCEMCVRVCVFACVCVCICTCVKYVCMEVYPFFGRPVSACACVKFSCVNYTYWCIHIFEKSILLIYIRTCTRR